ncbi:FKBP-type peptidyl-prolyl cis-trans isomerase [Myxococcota bacterium]|nr:FKBP-type peptidyl-prolyl cis-trans isomerase [Myxococcota bacterium]
MTRLLRLVFVSAALVGLLACQKGAESGSKEAAAGGLESDDQKTVYALGLALARELGPFHLSEAELATLADGLKDGALGREPKVDLEAQMPKIQEFGMARVAAAAADETKAAETFLTAAAAEPGAEKLESGLVYRETSAGTGESPKASDVVKVHYHGTLRDGTVFDSSVERGTPAEFPLNGVIPCWTEGVQKMKVGGKARLVCPASIAYGDRGAPPKIMPGAALAFDVELLGIGASPAPEMPAGHPPTSEGEAPKAE